jgi:nucleoid-associated protein YgaU
MTTTDPVQLLIEAGAIPSDPFADSSRYKGVALAAYRRGPDDPGTPYVLRRFIAQQSDITIALQHIVKAGDRPDLIAAQAFGDAEYYWRIADANAVTDPLELTDTPGQRINIPAPSGS